MIRDLTGPGSALELYVHIPFCVKKCAYCDFLSAPAGEDVISRYLTMLEREIRIKAVCLQNRKITSIFLGGGTPSLLSGEQIAGLMRVIRSSFDIKEDAEISLECNPKTADLNKLSQIREAGFNRISIGCQSVQDEELLTLGRVHDRDDFFSCFAQARTAGFTNINVDLIYGFPGQTPASFSSTLKQVCETAPEHLSVYRLIIEEGTPFFEKYDQDGQDRDAGKRPRFLPTEEEEEEMEKALSEVLSSYGYRQYEISNYAKPGHECRHNTGYWTGVDYLGTGLGASSCLNGNERFSNTADLSSYLKGDCRPINRKRLDKQMQMEEFMFLGLRLVSGIEEDQFLRKFGRPVTDIFGKQIRDGMQQGLLAEHDGRLFLTKKGMRFGNIVFASFLL